MKKTTRAIAFTLGAAMLLQMQGCYGDFRLTRKLYQWNGTVGDKWVNSIVMVAMVIIPVYGLAGLADFLALNAVQFWTGKNPVTMKEGEKEIQVVQWEGKAYQLTATPNRMEVRPLSDGAPQASVSLAYNPATRTWSADAGGQDREVMKMLDDSGLLADVIYPDGSTRRVDLSGR
jgi:hypothetical protein